MTDVVAPKFELGAGLGDLQAYTHAPTKIRAIQFVGANFEKCSDILASHGATSEIVNDKLVVTVACTCSDDPCDPFITEVSFGDFVISEQDTFYFMFKEDFLACYTVTDDHAVI